MTAGKSTLRYHLEFGVHDELVTPGYAQYLVDHIRKLESALMQLRGHLVDYIPPTREFKGPAKTAVEYIDHVLERKCSEHSGDTKHG